MLLLLQLLVTLCLSTQHVYNAEDGIKQIRRLLTTSSCCLDIVFAIDQSESVGFENWKKVMSFMCDMAQNHLEQDNTRVGIVRFGNPGGADYQENGEWWIHNKKYNTEVIFPLKRGVLKDQAQNICNLMGAYSTPRGYRPGRTALRAGLLLALREFTLTPKPTSCAPGEYHQWTILVTDGGPNPPYFKLADPAPLGEYALPLVTREAEPFVHEDPCALRQDLNPPEKKSVAQRFIDAGIQHMIIGIGERFNVHRKYCACMFGKTPQQLEQDPTFERIEYRKNFDELTDLAKKFQPQRLCQCSAVDLAIVMDESGSLCASNPTNAHPCPSRPEYDKEIEFARAIVAKLNPWENTRISLFKFGESCQVWTRLKRTGALSDCAAAGQNHCWNPTQTQAQVNEELDKMKANFREGRTALAMGFRDAIWELTHAPPRAAVNGKVVKPKKILLFLGDGGPNTPFYANGEGGKRVPFDTPGEHKCAAKSVKGFCINQATQWDGTETSNTSGRHQAVCLDKGEVGGQPIFANPDTKIADGKTYPQVIDAAEITPILVMVGPRASEHTQDIACLVEREAPANDVGVVIQAASFDELLNEAKFSSAIGKGVCGVSNVVASLEKERMWDLEWQTWLQGQTAQQSMKSIQNNEYGMIFGGAAVVGVAVAVLYSRKTKEENQYTPLLESV